MHVALNGKAGREAARRMTPDVILMDIGLPDIDGLEVARRLKADAHTCGIPIIAVTAYAMSGDGEKALAAGCDAFVTRPVDFARLLGKIEDLRLCRGPAGSRRQMVSATTSWGQQRQDGSQLLLRNARPMRPFGSARQQGWTRSFRDRRLPVDPRGGTQLAAAGAAPTWMLLAVDFCQTDTAEIVTGLPPVPRISTR